jgi:thiol-disulfide isomerase/thioredoxin
MRPAYVGITMNSFEIIFTLIALVATATALGVAWQKLNGRARRTGAVSTVDLGQFPGAPVRGDTATLLQFSTEMCSPCRSAHAVLSAIATEQPGVAHIDVDLTHRADLANKFNILQTPTTLILDRDGTIRARIGGAVKRATVIAELDNFLAPA